MNESRETLQYIVKTAMAEGRADDLVNRLERLQAYTAQTLPAIILQIMLAPSIQAWYLNDPDPPTANPLCFWALVKHGHSDDPGERNDPYMIGVDLDECGQLDFCEDHPHFIGYFHEDVPPSEQQIESVRQRLQRSHC